MLLGLRLQNIALIETLDLSFKKGFSVFTGETGAGKSVFLFSITTLLGGGTNISPSRLMRPGTNHCSIEGCFSIDSRVRKWLEKHSFDICESELFISRDWRRRDGRITSRLRLNGQIINLKQILSLRSKLIDFSQQGQSYIFNSQGEQLKLLDRFGSEKIDHALFNVKVSLKAWREKQLELEDVFQTTQKLQSEVSNMQNFLLDLESAEINDPLEEEQLKKEQDRLVHGVKLQEVLGGILTNLKDSADDFPSALDHFSLSIHELKSLIKLDSTLSSQLDILLESYSKLEDFLISIDRYLIALDSDPSKLDYIQNRLSQINRIKIRYGTDLNGLLVLRDQYTDILDKQNIESQLITLEKEEKIAKKELDKNNSILTNLRKNYALKLEDNLVKYLQPLGLENIKFKVDFSSSKESIKGVDVIQFMFSANEGQPLAPLAETASGGEMSRFLLVMTKIFAEVTGSSTLIFDEIDSGVSGRISSAIAKLLKELSLSKQVFCITHQPVVAALADNHFSVSKIVENGMTNSKVLLLKDFGERQSALANLAGGDFGQASIYAASLLDNKAA